MASFTVYDFSESLDRVGISRDDIEHVEAGAGYNGDYAEWEGAFVFRMKDGSRKMVSGWCDTTGWGCQDGAEVADVGDTPLSEIKAPDSYLGESAEWSADPIDLNRYIAGEIGEFD